jgi:hypothetical protein
MSEYSRNCQRHYSHHLHADGYLIVWRERARDLPWGHETVDRTGVNALFNLMIPVNQDDRYTVRYTQSFFVPAP